MSVFLLRLLIYNMVNDNNYYLTSGNTNLVIDYCLQYHILTIHI